MHLTKPVSEPSCNLTSRRSFEAGCMNAGYPLVAQSLGEVAVMLDRLRGSAALRQEAAHSLLHMARALSVAELVPEYESALCSFSRRGKKPGDAD